LRLPPVLLIKPVRTFEEPLHRRLRQREPARREVVAEEQVDLLPVVTADALLQAEAEAPAAQLCLQPVLLD